MSTKYLLVGVLVSFSPLLCGSTVVTATSSCQVFQSGTPILTQSESVAFTTNDDGGNINGLDCVTPYGSVIFNSVFFSKIDLIRGSGVSLGASSGEMTSNNFLYLLAPSVHVHVSTQETFIATGGTGIGILEGTFRGSFDYTSGVQFNSSSFSVTTPFGGCPPTCMEPLTAPFAVPFVFGQPFTIDLESDVAYETVQGGFASTSLGGSFMTGPPPLQPVYDVNGNPILFVVFTPVPEPGSAFLGGAALLFGAVFVARSRQIRLL